MADGSAAAAQRPTLVAPRTKKTDALVLEAVRAGSFDSDLYRIMESADDALVAEEVLHGAVSGAFVYSFPISGQSQEVTGISVIGAAHLARQYGNLKHRMVASVEKRGELFRFTSYPSDGHPMAVTCSFLPELKDDPDFYTSVIEIKDEKSGNSIQVEKTETRMEKRRDGTLFERPNFQTIAQSKSYRNGVLRLVPQDVQGRFKAQCLAQGKNKDITASAIDERRAGLMQYAASISIAIDRDAVFQLTWAQLGGLADAATNGGNGAFVNAARPLGILIEADDGEGAGTKQAALPKPTERPVSTTAHDPETGEVREPATVAQNGGGKRAAKVAAQEPAAETRAEPVAQPAGGGAAKSSLF